MSAFAQPLRFRQRFALMLAFLVASAAIQSTAWGQLAQPDPSIPDVVVTARQSFPVAEIERRPDPQPLPASKSQNPAATTDESTKSTFVFSPVELGPIRPKLPPAGLPLSPENAARLKIDQETLGRVFASGMIIDSEKTLTQPEMELVPSPNGPNSASDLPIKIAQELEQPRVNDPTASQSAGPASPSAPQATPVQATPQEKYLPGDLIISDVVVEKVKLPEPPLVGDQTMELAAPIGRESEKSIAGERLPPLPIGEVLPGMIEAISDAIIVSDSNCIPMVIDSRSQDHERVGNQLPGYSVPGGGVDIFLLAPTRFSKSLPNAR
jgi:hypothetical protein